MFGRDALVVRVGMTAAVSARRRLARGWVLASLAIALLPAASHGQQLTPRQGATALMGGGITGPEIDAVAAVLAQQIATFPVGTSSGGFTLQIDRETGVQVLKSPSFGPLFSERASTLGSQGMLAVGISAQSTRFVSMEGRSLQNGDLRSRAVLGGEIVDIDRYTLNASTQTTNLSVSYAADDNIDIGVIVPIVRISLNGTGTSLNLRSGRPDQRVVDATGAGLGDVIVRGKWNFFERRGGGLAAVTEVFLPTGSEERLSTTGRVRVRPTLVASATVGNFSPHVNLGYTFGGRGSDVRQSSVYLPTIVSGASGDELNFAIGADLTPVGPLTVFTDLVGRSMRNTVRFYEGKGLLERLGPGAPPIMTFVPYVGSLNTHLAAVGARTMVMGANALISFALLFPLTDGGLKPGLTPVVGFEYTFK